ncbi:hypothetical protein DPEC_G00211020 [Dallia pectoralis]|uniref:Uncharacterized protein n=1 Tax=Dallia pectoralis TaxID=75939 RepID=A0ACC2G642_DALPE|nr:hypothetical protein DPEC_G00211020 [Dallia pectoralis]
MRSFLMCHTRTVSRISVSQRRLFSGTPIRVEPVPPGPWGDEIKLHRSTAFPLISSLWHLMGTAGEEGAQGKERVRRIVFFRCPEPIGGLVSYLLPVNGTPVSLGYGANTIILIATGRLAAVWKNLPRTPTHKSSSCVGPWGDSEADEDKPNEGWWQPFPQAEPPRRRIDPADPNAHAVWLRQRCSAHLKPAFQNLKGANAEEGNAARGLSARTAALFNKAVGTSVSAK